MNLLNYCLDFLFGSYPKESKSLDLDLVRQVSKRIRCDFYTKDFYKHSSSFILTGKGELPRPEQIQQQISSYLLEHNTTLINSSSRNNQTTLNFTINTPLGNFQGYTRIRPLKKDRAFLEVIHLKGGS